MNCKATWETEGKKKICGYDLTQAKKVKGKDLVRCPECGRKLG